MEIINKSINRQEVPWYFYSSSNFLTFPNEVMVRNRTMNDFDALFF